MYPVSLLMLQIATIAPPAPAPDDRLLHPVPSSDCPATPSSEIIVCGAKDNGASKYRLPKLAEQPETGELPKAEWKIFGDAKMGVAGSERYLPGVGSAPAVMVTVKIPF